MKYLIVVCFLILSSITFAKDPVPAQRLMNVVCGTVEQATKLIREYGEAVVFIGHKTSNDNKGPVDITVIISVNLNTGSWSEFAALEDGTVCIVNGGEKGAIIPQNFVSRKVL